MLIFGKMKKKHKPQGNPPWLTWGVTLLVGYMLFSQYTDKNSQYNKNKDLKVAGSQEIGNQEVSSQADEAKIIVPDAPLAMPTTPEFQPALVEQKLPDGVKITGDIIGRGEGASCGHLLDLVYDEVAPDNTAFKPKESVSLSLRAGAKPSEIWHLAFDGMKVGGVRQVSVPAGSVYDAKELAENALKESDLMQYKVELKAIAPLGAADEVAMQIVNIQSGEGEGAVCNQKASFALILWGADGKKLYENESFSAAIGNVDYFYGLDKTLLGMKIGGERMAMVPPSYALVNEKAIEIKGKIAPNQMIMAQIKLLKLD